MLVLTIEQVLALEGWIFDHPYCLYVVRDGETIFSVGRSIAPRGRIQEHHGESGLHKRKEQEHQ
jgi:hypothetical protein